MLRNVRDVTVKLNGHELTGGKLDKDWLDLNVNPAFCMADFKAVPKEWRDKIPEYVKDYVSLNQFMQ